MIGHPKWLIYLIKPNCFKVHWINYKLVYVNWDRSENTVTCKKGWAPLPRPSLRRYYFSLIILHMTKSGPKKQFCKKLPNYPFTYIFWIFNYKWRSNISENMYTSRSLWDATANAKVHRRYFISKIFLDFYFGNKWYF